MSIALIRRGFGLGSVDLQSLTEHQLSLDSSDFWQQGMPTWLPGVCRQQLDEYTQHIQNSKCLYDSILECKTVDELLDVTPYSTRLFGPFECLGSVFNEGDQQEIETVIFDAVADSKTIAEDLWMKVSWLSFLEDDKSIRFRFSFGADHVEDVAADLPRQEHASILTEAIFPESKVITGNETLLSHLAETLSANSIRFVERIVYYNAPNGGAYLHHDRERGHAGVIYAQVTGCTLWLALTKLDLISEILLCVECRIKTNDWPDLISSEMQVELISYIGNPDKLSKELETFANNAIISLINETECFIQQCIRHGHARVLQAGDAILLPQESEDLCCWHSVMTIGDETGQGLSFAIRTN